MASTTIIGKVGVRVYPVTEHFRREAQRDLDKETKSLKAEVPLHVDEASSKEELRALLQKLKATAQKSEVDVKANLNEAGALKDARSLHNEMQRIVGDVKIDTSIKGDAVRELRGRLRLERLIAKAQKDGATNAGLTNTKPIDDLRAQLKIDKLIAKANDDQARSSAKVKKTILDSVTAAENLRREASRLEFSKKFEKTTENVKGLLAEVDAEIKEIDKHSNLHLELKLQGMTEAEREIDLLKARLQDKRNKLDLAVDLSEEDRLKALHEIDKLKRDIDSKLDNIKIKFNVKTPTLMLKYLGVKLAVLARDRVVRFIPTISKAAAARVATTLAALSGARLSGQLVEDLWDMVKNLDKAIPKMAALGTGIAGVAGWALSASANLFSLSAELARIAPAALALPGILGGIAIGAVVTGIALKDLNKQLPAAQKGWNLLKATIRSNFWAKAKAPIAALGRDLFPALRAGIAKTSTEIGNFFAVFANGLRTELGGNPLKNMFADLSKSVAIFTKHAGDIARIIRILGEEGAGELPRLAGFFGDLTKKFAGFLTAAQKDGSLQGWIDDGIQGMKDLGGAVYQVGRFLGGLAKIANMAGGTTLKSMTDTFKRAGDAVRQAHFQELLVNALKAADDMMSQISQKSGPGIKKMFESLATTAVTVFPVIGKIIGESLGGVAEALSRPGLQQGIKDFFDGVLSLVRALKPALGPLSDALGAMLTLAGRMAKAFGPVLSSLLQVVADTVQTIAPYVGDAVVALAGPFGDLIKQIAPAVHNLAESAGPLLKKFADVVGEFVKKITPDVVKTIDKISAFLAKKADQMNAKTMESIANSLAKIATLALNNLQRVIDFFDWLSTPDAVSGSSGLSDFVTLLGDIAGAADTAAGKVKTVLDIINQQRQAAHEQPGGSNYDKLAGGWNSLLNGLIDPAFWSGISQQFIDAFSFITDPVQWQQLGDSIKAHWNAIVTDPMWGEIKTVFVQIGTDIVNGLIEGIVAPVQNILTAWNTLCNQVIDFVKGLFGIHSPSTVFAEIGGFLIAGLIQGITSAAGLPAALSSVARSIPGYFSNARTWLISPGLALAGGLASGMGKGHGAIKTAAGGAVDAAKGGTGGADTALKGAGVQVINGFLDSIYAGYRYVRDALVGLTRMLPSWKGPASTDKVILREAGQLVIGGFITGLQSQFSAVRDTLGDLSKEIGNTELAAPSMASIQTADLRAARAAVSAQVAVGGTGAGATAPASDVTLVVQSSGKSMKNDVEDALFTLRDYRRGGNG